LAPGLGTLVTIYSGRYLALDRRYETYYPLLLLLVTGLTGMVLAADLFNLYLFCELMSLAAYALVSFRRHTDTAIEAGFKYLIMGSVGTILVLMGISFVYRVRGHLELPPVLLPLPGSAPSPGPRLWHRLGLACVMVGLGIKSAIVPLHTWLPDAHGRAPSSVSAMLSGVVIQSAFYVLIKVSLGLGFPARALGAVLIFSSLFNMTLGNGLALVQTNTKRLLAYSTIAQMGYVMLGVGVGLRHGVPAAVQAGFFLLTAHAAMKGLAFLSKGVCHFYNNSTTIAQLRGTYRQLPLVAVTFGLALAGLAGVPPLAGFAGKWFLLTRALQTAQGAPGARAPGAGAPAALYAALAVFLINNLAALGYFLPVIGALFAPAVQVERHTRIRISPWMAIPLVILGALVLALGFYPGPWLDWLEGVGTYLLGA
jgi:proton-translocating NADH-quinone oxidoreductase chain N